MNIENIKVLAAQLQTIGFKDSTTALMRRICFRPERFVLEQRKRNGSFLVCIQCHIEKTGDDYNLRFYDVALLVETLTLEGAINRVAVLELDAEMASIDWKKASEPDSGDSVSLENKSTWQVEARISSIVVLLHQLEETEEGKRLANHLKQKHWLGLSLTTLFGTSTATKDQASTVQRFYLQDGHNPITVDEACRLLQNKQLQRQMQSSRRLKFLTGDGSNEVHAATNNGKGRRGTNGKVRTKLKTDR